MNLCLWLRMLSRRIHRASSSGWSKKEDHQSPRPFHKPVGEVLSKEKCHQSYGQEDFTWQAAQMSSSNAKVFYTIPLPPRSRHPSILIPWRQSIHYGWRTFSHRISQFWGWQWLRRSCVIDSTALKPYRLQDCPSLPESLGIWTPGACPRRRSLEQDGHRWWISGWWRNRQWGYRLAENHERSSRWRENIIMGPAWSRFSERGFWTWCVTHPSSFHKADLHFGRKTTGWQRYFPSSRICFQNWWGPHWQGFQQTPICLPYGRRRYMEMYRKPCPILVWIPAHPIQPLPQLLCLLYWSIWSTYSMSRMLLEMSYHWQHPSCLFTYLPIIPRLHAMAANSSYATKSQYWAKHQYDPSQVTDVFDSSHYRALLTMDVVVGDKKLLDCNSDKTLLEWFISLLHTC